MALEKKVVIYPGIDIDTAMLLVKEYLKECAIEARRLGYSGMVIYSMKSGGHFCVYQTSTSYIVRTA